MAFYSTNVLLNISNKDDILVDMLQVINKIFIFSIDKFLYFKHKKIWSNTKLFQSMLKSKWPQISFFKEIHPKVLSRLCRFGEHLWQPDQDWNSLSMRWNATLPWRASRDILEGGLDPTHWYSSLRSMEFYFYSLCKEASLPCNTVHDNTPSWILLGKVYLTPKTHTFHLDVKK